MKLAICHGSPVARARLQRRIERAGLHLEGFASDLTGLYDLVEHRGPAAVIVAEPLTCAPEFEVMLALFSALGVRCLLLVPEAGNERESPPLTRGLPRISEAAGAEEIAETLSAATVASTRPPGRRRSPATTAAYTGRPARHGRAPSRRAPAQGFSGAPPRIVLIGASTGGVDALITLLGQFPADCPPTLIVQHTGGRFAAGLIRLLDGACPALVRPAVDGAPISTGEVVLAPGGEAHLALDTTDGLRCRLDPAPPLCGHRPSVDALFRSALPVAERVTAALLTGMGRDGAEGLLALRRAGARTLVQDKGTSVVYGMPRVAWELGAADRQLPLDRIAGMLLQPVRQAAGAGR